MLALIGLLLVQDVTPEQVVDCLRRAHKDQAAFCARLTAPTRKPAGEILIEYRPGEGLIYRLASASAGGGFRDDTLVAAAAGVSYRLVRMSATNSQILYGAGLPPAEPLILAAMRSPEFVLLAASLYPELFVKGAQVSREGKNRYRIVRPVTSAGFAPTLQVDSDSGRIVAYIEQFDRYDYIHTVEAWAGALPSKISSGYSMQRPALQSVVELVRLEAKPGDRPEWSRRADLPAAGGSDALSLSAAALLPLQKNRDALDRAAEALKRHLERNPKDPVAHEMMIGLLLSLNDRAGLDEHLAFADASIRIGLAHGLEQEGSADAAMKMLEAAKPTGVLERIHARIGTRLALAAAQTPDELVARLRQAGASRILDIADSLEPFAMARMGTIEQEPALITSKPKEFIEALRAHADVKPLALGLARHYARLGEGREAADFYQRILSDEALAAAIQGELEMVARTLSEAQALTDRLVLRGSRDPGVLAAHALSKLAAGDVAAAKVSAQQIAEIPGADYSRLGTLAEKLADAGEKELAIQTLVLYVKSLSYLQQEQARILRKVVGDDKEKLVEIARFTRTNVYYALSQLGIQPQEALAILRKRDESNRADERDYLMVCEIVRSRRETGDASALLTRAVEKFPDIVDFAESSGDARALEGQWPEAASALARAARLLVEGKRPLVMRGVSNSYLADARTFQPMDPLVIKLAFAFGKSGEPAAGERWVDALSKTGGEPGAAAYQLLGLTEKAIAAYKKLFFRPNRSVLTDPARLAANLVALLEKAGRREEAFYACDRILTAVVPQKQNVYWNPQTLGELRSARARLAETMGADALIKVALALPFDRLPEADEASVRRRVRDLGSEVPEERQAAHDELSGLGPRIGYLIKESVEDSDPEIKMRVRQMLLNWGEQELRRRLEQD